MSDSFAARLEIDPTLAWERARFAAKGLGPTIDGGNTGGAGSAGGNAGPAGRDITKIRDSNNNGRIFDGTKYEMPAPKKQDGSHDSTQAWKKRRSYLASRDTDAGPKGTQENQRQLRLTRAVARERMRGWEPSNDGRTLRPAAGRRGAVGPAGPRDRSGAINIDPGEWGGHGNILQRAVGDPSGRHAVGEQTRWAPGAADAPRRGRKDLNIEDDE